MSGEGEDEGSRSRSSSSSFLSTSNNLLSSSDHIDHSGDEMGDEGFFMVEHRALAELLPVLDKLENVARRAMEPAVQANQRVKASLQRRVDRTQNKIRAVRLRIDQRLDRIEERLQDPAVVSKTAQLTHFVGVAILIVTQYVLQREPSLFKFWYSGLAVVLLGFRMWAYSRLKWHWFMLDLCYLANFLCIAYTWLPYLPINIPVWYHQTLFSVVFSFANGPLLWAILLWKNCLDFRNIDRLTSVFIHSFPALATYAYRWLIPDAMGVAPQASLMELYGYPMLIYLLWQLAYTLWVDLLGGERVKKEGIITSFSWLSSSKGGFMYILLNKFPVPYQKLAFTALQLFYTILAISATPLLYKYQSVHLSVVLFVHLTAVWNGGPTGPQKRSQFPPRKYRRVPSLMELSELINIHEDLPSVTDGLEEVESVETDSGETDDGVDISEEVSASLVSSTPRRSSRLSSRHS